MYKKNIINVIDAFLLKKEEVLKKYSRPTLKEAISYFLFRCFTVSKHNDSVLSLNFLVTSNAEVRVFKPIIESLLDNNSCYLNVVYFSFAQFDIAFEKKITRSSNANVTKSVYTILESIKSEKSIFIICLDFLFYPNFHKVGIEIINYLNKSNKKTVCIQHGGTQKDNIIGQSTSRSKFQIVYGEYFYKKLIDSNISKNKLFITGNPWHDNILNIKKKDVVNTLGLKSFLKDRKVILLATCLHTEYMGRENEIELYRKYISKIYGSINFEKYVLIVKMHPSDGLRPNLYLEELIKFTNHDNSVKIIKHDENSLNFYECCIVSDLIISRSSTVIEEALMLNKKVISFDLFLDGPSKFYKHLENIEIYRKVIGQEANLKEEIKSLLNGKNENKISQSKLASLFTYKLDGKSRKRILDALIKISNL